MTKASIDKSEKVELLVCEAPPEANYEVAACDIPESPAEIYYDDKQGFCSATPLPEQQSHYSITIVLKDPDEDKSKKVGLKNRASRFSEEPQQTSKNVAKKVEERTAEVLPLSTFVPQVAAQNLEEGILALTQGAILESPTAPQRDFSPQLKSAVLFGSDWNLLPEGENRVHIAARSSGVEEIRPAEKDSDPIVVAGGIGVPNISGSELLAAEPIRMSEGGVIRSPEPLADLLPKMTILSSDVTLPDVGQMILVANAGGVACSKESAVAIQNFKEGLPYSVTASETVFLPLQIDKYAVAVSNTALPAPHTLSASFIAYVAPDSSGNVAVVTTLIVLHPAFLPPQPVSKTEPVSALLKSNTHITEVAVTQPDLDSSKDGQRDHGERSGKNPNDRHQPSSHEEA